MIIGISDAVIAELNTRARKGEIVSIGYRSIFGPEHVALADGSASLRRVDEQPAGSCAGAIFYWISGWELIAHGRVVARWVHGPQHVAMKSRAYARAHRWLLMKARRKAP